MTFEALLILPLFGAAQDCRRRRTDERKLIVSVTSEGKHAALFQATEERVERQSRMLTDLLISLLDHLSRRVSPSPARPSP